MVHRKNLKNECLLSLFFGTEFSDPVGNRRSSLGVPLYDLSNRLPADPDARRPQRMDATTRTLLLGNSQLESTCAACLGDGTLRTGIVASSFEKRALPFRLLCR